MILSFLFAQDKNCPDQKVGLFMFYNREGHIAPKESQKNLLPPQVLHDLRTVKGIDLRGNQRYPLIVHCKHYHSHSGFQNQVPRIG